MSPRARYLSATLTLVVLATAYIAWQGRIERPSPHLPAGSASVIRPASPARVAGSPTAREILDRAVALELTDPQVIRLHALDRLWTVEASRLEAAIRESEAEFAGFMNEAKTSKGVSLQQIQQRSTELRDLSAQLREWRQRHSAAAMGLLAGWQRQRLAKAGFVVGETGRD